MIEIEMVNVVAELVKTLAPLSTDERRRVVESSLRLFGDQTPLAAKDPENLQDGGADSTGLPSRANAWMKQNGITSGELEQIIHSQDGTVEFIAPSVPGSNDRDRTLNAYILSGVLQLLQAGNPEFEDGTARDLCKTLGCLNTKHHAEYIAGKGNEFTGSKEKGWTLTSPGLRRAADIVKELARVK